MSLILCLIATISLVPSISTALVIFLLCPARSCNSDRYDFLGSSDHHRLCDLHSLCDPCHPSVLFFRSFLSRVL
jgi:hypothetical protein